MKCKVHMICSFYLYLTPCINNIIINTQSSNKKPVAKKKGKNVKSGNGKGNPGLPQLSTEEKAKQRKNEKLQNKRRSNVAEANQLRESLGQKPIQNGVNLYIHDDEARAQLMEIKNRYAMWFEKRSSLPPDQRTVTWIHEQVGGEATIGIGSFRHYCVNGNPLPEKAVGGGANSKFSYEALHGYIEEMIGKVKAGDYTVDEQPKTGLYARANNKKPMRMSILAQTHPNFKDGIASWPSDKRRITWNCYFRNTLKPTFDRVYEKKNANVASATGGAKVGTNDLEGVVDL